jgi:hypothetical protein
MLNSQWIDLSSVRVDPVLDSSEWIDGSSVLCEEEEEEDEEEAVRVVVRGGKLLNFQT